MNSLEHFQKRLNGLMIKRPGLAFGLWGEAGIGKTHTTTHILHNTPCKNLSLHSTTKLSDLAFALPKPKTLPFWATRIFEKLEQFETLSTEQTITALGAVLSSIAPFVLHLEDLHEASTERLEWVQALAKMVIRLKGVALIVTSRTQPPEPFENIRLEKLDFETVKNVLELEAKATLPTQAMEWIYTKANGNPLFILEYFKFLARLGFVWSDGQKWRWRKPEQEIIPGTVQALIEQVLSQATHQPAVKDALEAKALLKIGSSDRLWMKVIDCTDRELQAIKQTLATQGIFVQGDFAHPLFREMILQNLTQERKKLISRRIVAILELDTPEAAAVFIGDAALDAVKALEILNRAAQKLEQQKDFKNAALLLAQASDYAIETKASLALKAARGLKKHVDPTKLMSLAEMVVKLLPDSPESTEALLIIAERHALDGRRAEMQVTLERLPAPVRSGEAWVIRYIGVLFDSGNYDDVLQIWQSNPEIQANCKPNTVYQVAHAFVYRGELEVAKGLAIEKLEQTQWTEHERASLVDILAQVAFYTGQYNQAEVYFKDLVVMYRNAGNEAGLANALRNGSVNRLQLGLYQESLADFEESMRIYASWGTEIMVAQTQIMFGSVLLEQGDYERLESMLQEALTAFRKVPDQPFLAHCLSTCILLYARWRTPQSAILAEKYARELLEVANHLQTPTLLALAFLGVSNAETLLGRPERGLAAADKALEYATQIAYAEAQMSAREVRGEALWALGQIDQAKAAWLEAARMYAESGMVLEGHRVGIALDRLSNNLVSAKTRLAWFESRGLHGAVDVLLERFPELRSTEITSKADPSLMRLELLGSLQITTKDKPQTIRGQKRQELLVLLLEARVSGKSELARLELFDALYPNEPEDRAASSLKELIRGTRASLGADAIQTTQNGYALGAVTSDIEEFFKTGDSSLWRGAYLQGLEISSLESVRESLELALQHCIQRLLETDPKEAARVSRFLLETNLYNLEHLRLCVLAFKACENYKTLGRVYTDARERLADVGENLPERWQDFLEILKPA
jgi:tetratricopeptide (TPR) repeat protein